MPTGRPLEGSELKKAVKEWADYDEMSKGGYPTVFAMLPSGSRRCYESPSSAMNGQSAFFRGEDMKISFWGRNGV